MSATNYKTIPARIAAYIIDEVILAPLIIAASVFQSKLHGTWGGVSVGALTLLLSTTYFVYFNTRYGATIGKKAMRCRIVSATDLSRISLKMAIKRELPLVVIGLIGLTNHDPGNLLPDPLKRRLPNLPVCWLVLDGCVALVASRRRAIHDLIAGTVVTRVD